jgi:Chaperone of endosialidase
MATSETEAGVDLLSKHPSKEVELRYRISVDDSGTKATLANILARRESGATDGGSLMFSTDAAGGDLAQRMVIDAQGKVGIGTENPAARLEVAGDGRFSGPLSVQDTLTASRLEVSGIAQVGGDLSVTGKLTAGSFAGDASELRNVTLADDSVTSAKLALDAASLSRVSNRTMVAAESQIGIGVSAPRSKLEVTSDWTGERGALELSGHKPTIRFTGGSDLANRSWIIHLSGYGPGDLEFYKKSPSDPQWIRRMSLTESGITKIPKLQLGNKWLLSGEGDAHANDDWLRLFDIQGAGYFGGFAAGKLYSIGGTVYGSDLRLKTEVSSLDRMVDKILALRGVRFKWRSARDEDSYRIGLIAQEVERVLPEVVETGPDGMKGINEAGLVAAIITAIKEQQAELSRLRTEFELFQRA